LAGQAYASPIVINFDNLANLDIVTVQYSGNPWNTTFSSDSSGYNVYAMALDVTPTFYYKTSTPPNVICSANPTNLGICNGDLILSFSVPLNEVTFDAFGNQTPFGQAFATVDIYENFASTPTVTGRNLLVEHTDHTNGGTCATTPFNVPDCQSDPQDIVAPNITKLVIKASLEIDGTAYDNFAFTQQTVSGVPEPSTLFLTGFCGIVWVGRRFLVRKRG
jgi:hypothetical protein